LGAASTPSQVAEVLVQFKSFEAFPSLYLTPLYYHRIFSGMDNDVMPPPRFPPPPPPPPPAPTWGRPEPSVWQKLKKLFAPVAVVGALFLKFFAKLKFILLPALKYFPVLLKTGGSMIITIGIYAMLLGFWYSAGVVLLIFVHECGHLIAARRLGLKVGAPVFIPFMGAFIALKEAPKNAWIEAQVGIGGPMLGAVGAGLCELVHLATGNPLFGAIANTTFFLNLFNLMPVGFLDGGRIVTALSPKLWALGFVILVVVTILNFNPLLLLIMIVSVPRLFSLFRIKTEAEQRYFEVTPAQRWTMATMYFGLIALLVLGMHISHIPREILDK
jgi:Zn-dependent protease